MLIIVHGICRVNVGSSFMLHNDFDLNTAGHTYIDIAARFMVFTRLLRDFETFVVDDLLDRCLYFLIVPIVGKTLIPHLDYRFLGGLATHEDCIMQHWSAGKSRPCQEFATV